MPASLSEPSSPLARQPVDGPGWSFDDPPEHRLEVVEILL